LRRSIEFCFVLVFDGSCDAIDVERSISFGGTGVGEAVLASLLATALGASFTRRRRARGIEAEVKDRCGSLLEIIIEDLVLFFPKCSFPVTLA